MLVDPVAAFRVLGVGAVVTDGAQQDGQGREPLLAVHDQELLHFRGAVARARRQDERADEVGRVGLPVGAVLGELDDVLAPRAAEGRRLPDLPMAS